MNIRHEFNRIGHLFTNGVEKTQKTAAEWVDERARQTNGMARRMRERVDLHKLVTTEDRIVRHLRENSTLYLVGAAVLLGALIAKRVMESREAPRAPLL